MIAGSTIAAWFLFAATASHDATKLSDVELAREFPELGLAYGFLFVTGVVVDVYLLIRLALHRSERQPFGKVTSPAWGVSHVLVGGGLVVGISFLLGLLMHLVVGNTSVSLTSLLLLQLVIQCGFVLGFLHYLRRRQLRWQEAFGLGRTTVGRALAMGTLLCLASAPPLMVITLTYERVLRAIGLPVTVQEIVQQFFSTSSLSALLLLIAFAVVVAPIFEELLFRGFAYPALKQRLGAGWAVLIVSALFAAMHAHLASAGPLFALGAVLVFAYEYTGSIVAPMALHAVFNATSVAALLYARGHL